MQRITHSTDPGMIIVCHHIRFCIACIAANMSLLPCMVIRSNVKSIKSACWSWPPKVKSLNDWGCSFQSRCRLPRLRQQHQSFHSKLSLCYWVWLIGPCWGCLHLCWHLLWMNLTLCCAIVVAVAVAAAGRQGHLILSGAVALAVPADASVPALPHCAYVLPASSLGSGSTTLAYDAHQWQFEETLSCWSDAWSLGRSLPWVQAW